MARRAVELFDVGHDPQHVTFFVHPLEDGAGPAGQPFDLIDYGTRYFAGRDSARAIGCRPAFCGSATVRRSLVN